MVPFQFNLPDQMHTLLKTAAVTAGVSMRVFVLQIVADKLGVKYASSQEITARGFHIQGTPKTAAAKAREFAKGRKQARKGAKSKTKARAASIAN